jgi:hypothetical protein
VWTMTQTEAQAVELSPVAVRALAETQAAHDDPTVSEAAYGTLLRSWAPSIYALPEPERVRLGWECFRFSFRAIIGREPSWAEYWLSCKLRASP